MYTLVIYVSHTWIKFQAARDGTLCEQLNIFNFLKNKLCEYDYQIALKRYTLSYRYFDYDKANQMCIIPRYLLDSVVEWIGDNMNITYQVVDPVPGREISLRMKDKYTPREDQKQMISFMTESSGFKPISAATGAGKTIMSEFAICALHKTTMVVLGQLIDQWYDSISEHTNISRKDIYIVKGIDSLRKLWQARLAKRNKYRPKIILFSTRTLYSYAVENGGQYADLPSYDQFLVDFGIGIKIVDECHLNFHATTMIDLHSNIQTNIYLSATYGRSSRQGEKIFNAIFPQELTYGAQFAKKYTRVFMIGYRIYLPGTNTKFKCAKGYNHALYENFLYKHRGTYITYFDYVIKQLFHDYYMAKKKDGQKALILAQTRAFCELLMESIKKAWPELKTNVYFSSDKKVDREDIFSSDVIVSTIKSSSTGLDIKGLKTAINTVSFGSPPQASQVMGRLRQIPDEETIFVDIYNKDIPSHEQHRRRRMDVYYRKALHVHHLSI